MKGRKALKRLYTTKWEKQHERSVLITGAPKSNGYNEMKLIARLTELIMSKIYMNERLLFGLELIDKTEESIHMESFLFDDLSRRYQLFFVYKPLNEIDDLIDQKVDHVLYCLSKDTLYTSFDINSDSVLDGLKTFLTVKRLLGKTSTVIVDYLSLAETEVCKDSGQEYSQGIKKIYGDFDSGGKFFKNDVQYQQTRNLSHYPKQDRRPYLDFGGASMKDTFLCDLGDGFGHGEILFFLLSNYFQYKFNFNNNFKSDM